MTSSAERSKAHRIRRALERGTATDEQRTWLAAYDARRGAAGRPRSSPAAQPAPPGPAVEPPLVTPPPEPPSEAPGGAAPPLQVDVDAAAGDGPREPTPEEKAAAAAAAERATICAAIRGYIVTAMHAMEPVLEAARAQQLPVPPPIPQIAYPVIEQAWDFCLQRWLPTDVNLEDAAPYVAVGSTTYQLGAGMYAASRLKRAADEAPPKPAAAARPNSPPPPPPSSPPPNGAARKPERDEQPRGIGAGGMFFQSTSEEPS